MTLNGHEPEALDIRPDLRQGDTGPEGPQGADGTPGGPQGPEGPQGPPGEVTLQQLDDAIATTSTNSNAVATLDTPYADPDTEELRLKLNELLTTLRR